MCADKVLVLDRPSREEVRLPKGHIDPGETSEIAALREVEEESGYRNLKITADLCIQIVEFPYEGERIRRTEQFFLMCRDDAATAEIGVGEEQFEPRWVSFEKALRTLSFETEREWVRRALAACDEEKDQDQTRSV